MLPSDSQEIGLTVAGIAACPNTDEILSLYVRFIQVAAELEKFWQPPAERPDAPPNLRDTDLTSISSLALTTERDPHLLQLLPLIISAEQAGWGGLGQQPDGHWTVTLTREIRRFRNVADIDDYWSKRHKFWEHQPPIPSQPVALFEPWTVPSGEGVAHVPGDAPIFIVHGTDTVRAEAVANTVSRATGRKTIILRDQPNLSGPLRPFPPARGRAARTIIDSDTAPTPAQTEPAP